MGNNSDPTAEVPKRAATITDVAELAGVAVGTVSRYLNGFAVRRSNQNQVEDAIAKLQYRRNALAAAMKTDKTHIIGFLVPSFDEFHGLVLETLARSVRSTSRALLTYCHSNEPREFHDALGFFASQRVDALIMDGTHVTYPEVDALTRQGVPVLIYNNDVEGIAANRVMVDNFQASYRAVSHLIDLGHSRIAILTGDLRDSSAKLRLAGYEAALRDRGLPLDPAYTKGPNNWGTDRAAAVLHTLMTLPTPPTAIFSSNYQIAIGALTWLKARGLRVPDDLSLVSFDDVALFRLHEAGITAIAQPHTRIAESITDMLVAALTNADGRVPHTITLDCDLILRGSTRLLA